jgi:preprotein translocase subunit SecA
MPMVRDDQDDEVYRTGAEKYRAIIALIKDCKERGQPVLVGTTSIEKSEMLAQLLSKEGWEQHDFSDVNAFAKLYSGDEGAKNALVFAVLNARYHEHHLSGGRAGCRHDCNQYGRPRHRHSARR